MAGFKQKNRIWHCENSEFGLDKRVFCGPGQVFLFEAKHEAICAIDKTPGREFFSLDKRSPPKMRFEEYKSIQEIPMCPGKNVFGGWKDPKKGETVSGALKFSVPLTAQSEFFEFLGFEEEIIVESRGTKLLTKQEEFKVLNKYSKNKKLSGYYKSLRTVNCSSPRLRWYTKDMKSTTTFYNLEAFRNKSIIMIGDSLIRKVFDSLVSHTDCKSSGKNWKFLGLGDLNRPQCHTDSELLISFVPRQFYCSHTNTSMYFMTHGQPFHLKDTHCQNCLIHVSELIDRMISHNWIGPEYSIYATYGAHLSTFNPIVFARMLINVKTAVAKYKQFSPESQFIFRTTTMMRGTLENSFGVVNGFNQDRFREITYRIFGGDDNIRIFDPFISVETLFDRLDVGNIHQIQPMINAEAKYLMEFYAAAAPVYK